ncbi:hypothetical protein BGY98DRAFT_1099500 [Russula aff. rugulosa BPL654]|nr:hypothetical protein BGY98DRAFT_1099500 [Russula aff. rugulosa BPL654]
MARHVLQSPSALTRMEGSIEQFDVIPSWTVMVVANLKAIALRHLPSIPRVTTYEIEFFSAGEFNKLYLLHPFAMLMVLSNPSYCNAGQRPRRPILQEIKATGEVATLKFVGENTYIPISRVSLESLWNLRISVGFEGANNDKNARRICEAAAAKELQVPAHGKLVFTDYDPITHRTTGIVDWVCVSLKPLWAPELLEGPEVLPIPDPAPHLVEGAKELRETFEQTLLRRISYEIRGRPENRSRERLFENRMIEADIRPTHAGFGD